MPEDLSVAVTAKTLKSIEGIGLDSKHVMKDGSKRDMVLSSFDLHVLYLAEDGTELGVASINVGDGLITEVMGNMYDDLKTASMPTVYDPAYQVAYDDAKAADESDETAKGLGRAAGNQALIDAGVVPLDPQEAWASAVSQVEGGKTADQLVTMLMKNAGPANQKWGRKILVDAFAEIR